MITSSKHDDQFSDDGKGRRLILKLGTAIAMSSLTGTALVGCGGGGDGDGNRDGNGDEGDGKTRESDGLESALPAGATRLTIVLPQNSRFADSQINVMILGRNPDNTSEFGYVDLSSGIYVPTGSPADFVAVPGIMSRQLSMLRSASGKYALLIPRLSSGRVYFAFGGGFDQMPAFGAGGPIMARQNPVLFDKFELDTSTNPNVNMTSVDFYGVSFTITATDANSGQPKTIGFARPRSDVLSAFQGIAACPANQDTGNTNIFQGAAITDANGDTLRILAPKATGLTDWAGATLQQQIAMASLNSHFWDGYVNTLCWKPNRTFSFYNKLLDGQVYYGRVSSDGLTLSLFTDAAMAVPYASVPSLPRPSNPAGVPDFTPAAGQFNLYHNVDSALGAIDWGFLLGGNVVGKGMGAHWASDPAAIAIMVSICRGVMHLDDGRSEWTNPSRFYQSDGSGASTASMPIFHYAKILHEMSVGGKNYALSYDDVYGTDPTIYFKGHPEITVEFKQF